MRGVERYRIPPRSGAGFSLRQGEQLRVIDPEGGQVSDLFCVDADDPRDLLSTGRSLDYADSVFLTTGHRLYSSRSQPMLRILEDTCRRHDLLLPPCSLRMFGIEFGTDAYRPSCHENLARALQPWGVGEDAVDATFNLFMHVAIAANGKIEIRPPLSRAGNHILLEAERDLRVGLTACAHPPSNAGRCKPIEYEIRRVPAP